MHGRVDQVLDRVVGPWVPVRLSRLVGLQLDKSGAQALAEFVAHDGVRLDGCVLTRVDGECQPPLFENGCFAPELGDALRKVSQEQ